MRLTFCAACGSTKELNHHHLVPRANGGSEEPENLVTLCAECHDLVHSRPYHWRELWQVGIARAKSNGWKPGRPLSVDREEIRRLRDQGVSPEKIWKMLGVARSSVYRVLAENGWVLGRFRVGNG
jgi:hypothetical protein